MDHYYRQTPLSESSKKTPKSVQRDSSKDKELGEKIIEQDEHWGIYL